MFDDVKDWLKNIQDWLNEGETGAEGLKVLVAPPEMKFSCLKIKFVWVKKKIFPENEKNFHVDWNCFDKI